jgi:hypothetical protein
MSNAAGFEFAAAIARDPQLRLQLANAGWCSGMWTVALEPGSDWISGELQLGENERPAMLVRKRDDASWDLLLIEQETEAPVTSGGMALTTARMADLVEQSERGHDPEHLRPRRNRHDPGE